MAVKHHHPWLLLLWRHDAGSAQGLLDVDVVGLDKTAAVRVDVGAGPGDAASLAATSDHIDGVCSGDAHSLTQVAREAATGLQPYQIVAVPGLRLLHVELSGFGILVQRLPDLDILAIDADPRPGVDVVLRP